MNIMNDNLADGCGWFFAWLGFGICAALIILAFGIGANAKHIFESKEKVPITNIVEVISLEHDGIDTGK